MIIVDYSCEESYAERSSNELARERSLIWPNFSPAWTCWLGSWRWSGDQGKPGLFV